MNADSRRLLSALQTRVAASLRRRTVGELAVTVHADLPMLRETASTGPPAERAAAILVLDAIGHPIEVGLDVDLLANATVIARVGR